VNALFTDAARLHLSLQYADISYVYSVMGIFVETSVVHFVICRGSCSLFCNGDFHQNVGYSLFDVKFSLTGVVFSLLLNFL
jgi:hypothetical protein